MKCLLIRMTQQTPDTCHLNSLQRERKNNPRSIARNGFILIRTVEMDIARCGPAASRKLRSASMARRAGKLREL